MIWQTLLAVMSGVPIGFQLGATGAGGALLAVPLPVYVVGTSVQEAAAISLVVVAASALLGAWEYGRAGLFLGARLGTLASPGVMSRTVASVTVSLALWLILFNSAKLLRVHL